MTTLSLTDPSNGTVADANTIVSNNSAIKAVVNGNIDNANVAVAAALSVSKLAAGASGQVIGMLAGTPTWLGGMALIQELSGAGASFDFTSIPATYRSLKIVVYGRSDTALNNTNLLLRFNNDTAANYDWQNLQGGATTTASSEGLSVTSILVGELSAASGAANYFSQCTIEISEYAGTTGNKVAHGTGIMKYGNGTAAMLTYVRGGGWRTTGTAVTRVTVFPAAGSFIAGSRASLYGLG